MISPNKKTLFKKIVSLPSKSRQATTQPKPAKPDRIAQYRDLITQQRATMRQLQGTCAQLTTTLASKKSQAAQAQTQSESDKAQLTSLSADLANAQDTLRLAEEATLRVQDELTREKAQQQQLVRAQDDSVREATQAKAAIAAARSETAKTKAKLQTATALLNFQRTIAPQLGLFYTRLTNFLYETLSLTDTDKLLIGSQLQKELNIYGKYLFDVLNKSSQEIEPIDIGLDLTNHKLRLQLGLILIVTNTNRGSIKIESLSSPKTHRPDQSPKESDPIPASEELLLSTPVRPAAPNQTITKYMTPRMQQAQTLDSSTAQQLVGQFKIICPPVPATHIKNFDLLIIHPEDTSLPLEYQSSSNEKHLFRMTLQGYALTEKTKNPMRRLSHLRQYRQHGVHAIGTDRRVVAPVIGNPHSRKRHRLTAAPGAENPTPKKARTTPSTP
jgi:predicted  nucleic acid-binding Zn-ribbon protein